MQRTASGRFLTPQTSQHFEAQSSFGGSESENNPNLRHQDPESEMGTPFAVVSPTEEVHHDASNQIPTHEREFV